MRRAQNMAAKGLFSREESRNFLLTKGGGSKLKEVAFLMTECFASIPADPVIRLLEGGKPLGARAPVPKRRRSGTAARGGDTHPPSAPPPGRRPGLVRGEPCPSAEPRSQGQEEECQERKRNMDYVIAPPQRRTPSASPPRGRACAKASRRPRAATPRAPAAARPSRRSARAQRRDAAARRRQSACRRFL